MSEGAADSYFRPKNQFRRRNLDDDADDDENRNRRNLENKPITDLRSRGRDISDSEDQQALLESSSKAKEENRLSTAESRANRRASRQLELAPLENKIVNAAEQIPSGVNESQSFFSADSKFEAPAILEPIRTDPVNALQAKQRRLERLSATNMPEYHCIGQIISGRGITNDTSEGAYCRWKVDFGKAWHHIDGETLGQTHVAYNESLSAEDLVFNHPIDLHFAELGFQGWGAPRILFQCSRVDWHGRRLLSGYGFVHLPNTPGYHKLEVPLWRPTGNLQEEMGSYFLGKTPALVSPNPIYESAWKDRCRLVTTSAGTITLELYVVTRRYPDHKVDLI